MTLNTKNYDPAERYGAEHDPDTINGMTHYVIAAGEHTWTGGGTTDNVSVSGLEDSDIVVASISSVPSEAAYLAAATVDHANDQIDFTLSAANTSNDGVISYQVVRSV